MSGVKIGERKGDTRGRRKNNVRESESFSLHLLPGLALPRFLAAA